MDTSAEHPFGSQNEPLKAASQLIALLSTGDQAGREKGWLSIDAVEAELGIKNDQASNLPGSTR